MKRVFCLMLAVLVAIAAPLFAQSPTLTMLVDVSDAAWNSSGSTSIFAAACAAAANRINAKQPFILVAYDPGGKAKMRADELMASVAFSSPLCTKIYRSDPFVVTPPAPSTVSLGLIPDLTALGTLYALPSNWWNLDVTSAPIDPKSSEIIAKIRGYESTGGRMHPDFGGNYGIPYCVVDGNTPLVQVQLSNTSESDRGYPGAPAGYPIPAEAATNLRFIENAGGTDGDRHMLIFDRDRRAMFELSYVSFSSGTWSAGYGAVFKLESDYRRPEGWTSTDAAGLCLLAGLVRYDEAYGAGPIRHAIRCSLKQIGTGYASSGYVWPASHKGSADAGAPPLGMRLRLKADFPIAGYPPELQRIFQAMKTYGLIVADRGGNMYVQGTLDARWSNAILNPGFHDLHVTDFDVLKLGWKP